MVNIRDYDKLYLYEMGVSCEFRLDLKRWEDLGENEKPSILSNTMFKTMLYNTKRLKYSAKLISYFIDVSYLELLSSMKLVKNELDKDYNDSKEERSDFVAEVGDTKINIEINNNDSIETMERNMEYAHRLYAERVKIGESYKGKYNQVIQLNINNFAFKGNDKIIDIYSFQNDCGIVLNKKIIIIEIFVPNLRKKCYNLGKESLSEAEKYILALVEQDKDFSIDIGGDIDIMIEYVDDAGNVTMGTNFGEAYDKEWALKDQGRREGRMEGENNKTKELALKMLKENIDISTISRITGLEIEVLKNME